MDYAYSDLLERSKQWSRQAAAAGWLSKDDYAAWSELDSPVSGALCALSTEDQTRPLIVAFFGGTGVGKSSLLNRLAGAPIANSGVERPTSREVTLYHHRSIAITQLPAGLPLDKIKLAHHDDDAQRAVIWIDMPDFDSTEQGNKQLALQWLAHIDILIYVVSPERYRDNKAWRILQAEGGKHAWLFVLNQWDRGQQEQYDDFVRQLHLAGFENPLVLRTVCNGAAHDDEFRQLQTTIASLGSGHTVEHLQQRGHLLKKQQLQQLLRQQLNKFGSEADYRGLAAQWRKQWAENGNVLQQAMHWPLQQMAGFYAARQGDLLESAHTSESIARRENFKLWDDWAQSRFEDSLDEVILLADQMQLPFNAIRQTLAPLRSQAEKTIHDQTGLAVRTALAKPGNGMQRFILVVARIAEIVLPLAAMAWASYQVLQGYYQSSLTHSAYLGVDFAVHSILLIALSWLVPFFVQKKIQPSLQKTALGGLKKGLHAALARIDAEVAAALRNMERQRSEYVAQGEKLLLQCAAGPQAISVQDNTLARMLLSDQSGTQ